MNFDQMTTMQKMQRLQRLRLIRAIEQAERDRDFERHEELCRELRELDMPD